jgi:hypothetical protein
MPSVFYVDVLIDMRDGGLLHWRRIGPFPVVLIALSRAASTYGQAHIVEKTAEGDERILLTRVHEEEPDVSFEVFKRDYLLIEPSDSTEDEVETEFPSIEARMKRVSSPRGR